MFGLIKHYKTWGIISQNRHKNQFVDIPLNQVLISIHTFQLNAGKFWSMMFLWNTVLTSANTIHCSLEEEKKGFQKNLEPILLLPIVPPFFFFFSLQSGGNTGSVAAACCKGCCSIRLCCCRVMPCPKAEVPPNWVRFGVQMEAPPEGCRSWISGITKVNVLCTLDSINLLGVVV